jgi:hypothetical protein
VERLFVRYGMDSVAVGADGPDVKASVFDARTGKKLFQAALDGLIAGNDGGRRRGAVAGHQRRSAGGMQFDRLGANRDMKPSSICYVPGLA